MTETFIIDSSGRVLDRESGRIYGLVRKTTRPRTVLTCNGAGQTVVNDKGWEARRTHDALTVGKSFPFFPTRREAAQSLVNGPYIL